MAFVIARPLNLLLSWGADQLNACLSDGHTLGRMGQLTVAPQLLSAASTEGWAALQGEPAEREHWGRVIFQQLFPPAIGQALSGSPGGLLQLQLSDALLEIPWELAFDGNSYLGQKYAVNRQLTRDKLPNPGLLRQARQRPGLKVLLVYEQTDTGRQQAYARALASRLAKLTGVSPLAMALPTHGFAALLRQTAGSDIVHCVASPGGLAHLPLPDMAALACPPQHLVVEDTAEAALAGQGLQALHKLSRAASAAALDLLVHLPNAGAQNRVERMVDFYTAYAAGQALDLALRCWRQAPQASLLCYAAGSSGSALASASQSPGDHLRQITVLSYDLVESTKLLRRLGAERYSETLGRFHGQCAEAVRRWGGQANAAQGNDGVMCFFGMPVAHEDATAMALKAALAMVDAVSQLGLAVRIGVVTGPVVVSAGLPLGEPIHLAARLQALAKPGTIVVAESSRSMVQERFAFVPMGSMPTLKGFGQTDAAYTLVSEQPQVDTLSDRLHGGPCVGRQRELAQLDGAWARACGGTLATVDISGEAGIGKTRLVHEFMRRLQDAGAQVLELRCDPECTDSAFQPVLELLARRFGLKQADGPQDIRSKLALGLQCLPNAPALVDGLAHLLEQPSAATEAAAFNPPEKIRQQTLQALLLWLQTLARQAPLCLVVEDQQWLDPSSQELIGLLLRESTQLALLLLQTQRSGPAPAVFSEPGASGALPEPERLELLGLSAADGRTLLAALCQGPEFSATNLAFFVERTDGVPLFIEETARTLLAQAHQAAQPGPGLQHGRLDAPLPVPGRVQDLLMARLDRLNSAKVVAQFGSVIGRRFSQALIEAVFADPFAPMSVHSVVFHLEALVSAGVLRQSGLGSELSYEFRHALMQDAAYASLWERDRRLCHQATLQVLRNGWVAGQPEILARHSAAAGLPEAALGYWESAARLAIGRCAQVEASRHLEAALGQAELLADQPTQNSITLRLLLLQASQCIALEGYGAARVGDIYRRADDLSRQCADHGARLRVQFGLAGYLFMRGEFDLAQSTLTGAAELVQASNDPMRRVQADWAMANLQFHQGQLAAALALMDRCLASYAALERRSAQVQDPAVMSLGYSALAQWSLGFADDARARSQRALALAKQLEHPLSLGEAQGLGAMLHCYQKDYLATLACAERAIQVCEASGFAVWLAHARIMHGWAIAHLGRPQDGLAEIVAAYGLWTSTGAVVTCAFYLALQAQVQALAGAPQQGLVLLQQAYATATQHGERYFEPELCRLQGELLIHLQHPDRLHNQDQARDWFGRALAVAQDLQMPAFATRAMHSLSELAPEPAAQATSS